MKLYGIEGLDKIWDFVALVWPIRIWVMKTSSALWILSYEVLYYNKWPNELAMTETS